MATPKRIFIFSLIVSLFVSIVIIDFLQPQESAFANEAVIESVTGTVAEIIPGLSGLNFKYLRIVPGSGDDVWVAVKDNAEISLGSEYTFEGPAYKNYQAKTIQKTFSKIIFSSGPQ